MTPVAVALREAAGRLAKSSDTPRLDAEVLMARALGVPRSELLLRHTRATAPPAFAALVERRAAHEPVAYIVGEQEFYGRTFTVGPGVLIPRADSETTVAAALEAHPDPRRVLDCGTGSGALLLTVLAENPSATGIGIDSSEAALAVASDNAERLGLTDRAAMQARNWRSPGWAAGLGLFDLILANPPYVETGARLEPSVRNYEPGSALFAGSDGLDDYFALIPGLPALLVPGGVAVLEIGATQAASVAAIAADAGFSTELRRDLADRPRALVLTLGLGKGSSGS